MQLPYSDQLNIAALSRLFDNKSECYKLFWFQAILGKVCSGDEDILYEDLIDRRDDRRCLVYGHGVSSEPWTAGHAGEGGRPYLQVDRHPSECQKTGHLVLAWAVR